MNSKYLNIYNNLIKLTRNKLLYLNKANKENFSDRMIIFFFHMLILPFIDSWSNLLY